MSARQPGDVDIEIGGEKLRLRLTLGALAHMEEAIGGGDLSRLFERLKAPGAGDLLHLLHALLLGGGHALTLKMLKESDVDIAEAGRAIALAMKALSDGEAGEAREEKEPAGKPPPRRSAPEASPLSDGYATR
jgi:hypothetical protein